MLQAAAVMEPAGAACDAAVNHDVETEPLKRTVRGPPRTQPCPGPKQMVRVQGSWSLRGCCSSELPGRWIFDAKHWPQASKSLAKLSLLQLKVLQS